MDALHKILAGNPDSRKQLIAAGIFVAVWFVIDVVEFVDWAVQKYNPPNVALCLPTGTPMLTTLPRTQITPGG